MSTSATKTSQHLHKTGLTYAGLSLFLLAFSRLYQALSYGEVAFHMHYLWLPPALGGLLACLVLGLAPHVSRLTRNLWHSGVATVTIGFLFRGIVNLSGRATTLDHPYWLMGAAFLALAVLSHYLIHPKKTN